MHLIKSLFLSFLLVRRTVFCVFIVMLSNSFSVKSQTVAIPDPEFVIFLQTNYPSCISGNQLDTICLGSVSAGTVTIPAAVADPYGLEFFGSIHTLSISNTSIDTIFNLPNQVDYLYLWDNFALNYMASMPNSMISLGIENLPLLTAMPEFPLNLADIYIVDCPLLTSLYNIPEGTLTAHIHGTALTSLPDLPSTLYVLLVSENNLFSIPELPDGLENFTVYNNPNLTCLPRLPDGVVGESGGFPHLYVTGTQITCLPNIPMYLVTGLPVCMEDDPINNPNACFAVNGISGYVYNDVDNNCEFDLGTDIPGVNVKLYLTNQTNDTISVVFSGSDGHYNFLNLPDGDYTVLLDTTNVTYVQQCAYPGSDSLVTLWGNSDVGDVNFSVLCATNSIHDVAINSFGFSGFAFPGLYDDVVINAGVNFYSNGLACGPGSSGTVEVIIDGNVSYVGSGVGALVPSSVSGDTLTYAIADFTLLQPGDFQIILLTDTTATIGDLVCISAEAISDLTDPNLSNNAHSFCSEIGNSYDPNMKSVYPEMVGLDFNDWLTYTIHFQNTGTAPAINVKLRDTLSDLLQTNSFQLLSYSHDVSTQILNDVVVFKFKNIYLPDSASNPEGSIGFVQFRIKPVPNLPVGTVIENEVYIYFDYNSPILTNTATTSYMDDLNLTEYTQENLIVVYPNPSESVFYFTLPEIESLENITIQIYSVTGEQIMETTQSYLEINQVNLQNFTEGIYILKVSTSAANYVQRILKIN